MAAPARNIMIVIQPPMGDPELWDEYGFVRHKLSGDMGRNYFRVIGNNFEVIQGSPNIHNSVIIDTDGKRHHRSLNHMAAKLMTTLGFETPVTHYGNVGIVTNQLVDGCEQWLTSAEADVIEQTFDRILRQLGAKADHREQAIKAVKEICRLAGISEIRCSNTSSNTL